jgi:general secretion pathway protein A
MVSLAANEVQPSEERIRSSRWPVLGAVAGTFLILFLAVLALGPPEWRLLPGNGASARVSAETPAVVAASPGVPSEAAHGSSTPAINDAGPAPGVAGTTEQASSPAAVSEATIGNDPQQPVGDLAAAPAPALLLPAELDGAWLDQQHQAAWQEMADLWRDGGSPHAIQAACDGAPRTGYACIREQGNWSRIRQLGLPVVLVLRDVDTRLLVLRGFADGALLVGQDRTPGRVSRDAVEQRWLGEYYVVWPQAPDWPAEIRRGESGTAVDIVMGMAAFAEPAWSGSGIFDEHFETWLMAFQRRNGLRADGIIGPKTLMHLVAPTIAQPRLVLETRGGP